MFLSSHLPPHWRGHTLEQKKRYFPHPSTTSSSSSPPSSSSSCLSHLFSACDATLFWHLTHDWLSSTRWLLPVEVWIIQSDLIHLKKTEALHLLKRDGKNTEWVCEPPKVTRWCGPVWAWPKGLRLLVQLSLSNESSQANLALWSFSAPSPLHKARRVSSPFNYSPN